MTNFAEHRIIPSVFFTQTKAMDTTTTWIQLGLIALSILPLLAIALVAYQTRRAGFNIVGTCPLKSKMCYRINKKLAALLLLLTTSAALCPTLFLHIPGIIQNKIAEVQKLLAMLFLLAGNLLLIAAYHKLSIFTRFGLPQGEHALHTDGVFALSRNPIYTSLFFFYTATFLLVPSWVVGISMGFVLLTNHAIILSEENYLQRSFGAAYAHYKKHVARYL